MCTDTFAVIPDPNVHSLVACPACSCSGTLTSPRAKVVPAPTLSPLQQLPHPSMPSLPHPRPLLFTFSSPPMSAPPARCHTPATSPRPPSPPPTAAAPRPPSSPAAPCTARTSCSGRESRTRTLSPAPPRRVNRGAAHQLHPQRVAGLTHRHRTAGQRLQPAAACRVPRALHQHGGCVAERQLRAGHSRRA